jgi:hypothetical protein
MQFADCIQMRGEPVFDIAPSEIGAEVLPLHGFHRVAGPQFETQLIKQHRIHLAAPFHSNYDRGFPRPFLDKALSCPFGTGFLSLARLLSGATKKIQ